MLYDIWNYDNYMYVLLLSQSYFSSSFSMKSDAQSFLNKFWNIAFSGICL